MATLIELKPCPHCGSSDVRAGTRKGDFEDALFEVGCFQCPASMGFLIDAQPWGVDIKKLEAETIAAWNRRTSPDAINALADEARKVLASHDAYVEANPAAAHNPDPLYDACEGLRAALAAFDGGRS